MKVRKLMTTNVALCGPATDLVTAARIMAANDCGSLAVLDSGKVVGIVTDRDICMAVAAQGQNALSTRIDSIMSDELYECSPDDNVKSALKKMRKNRIRRLPVVENGGVEGILSITDVALNAGRKRRGPSYRSVVSAYRDICRRQTAESAGQESPNGGSSEKGDALARA